MRKCCFIGIFLLIYTICRADRADSLLGVLKKNIPDTERVNVLSLLCYEKYLSDIEQAQPYGRQAVALAKKINYPKGLVHSYLYLAYAVKGSGQIEEALKLIDSAMTVCNEHSLDRLKVKVLNEKGNIYGDRGDISRSLSYYLEASKLSEKYNDKRTLVGAYANIGICFMSSRQYDKSKEYLRKAMALAQEMNEPKNLGNIYNNLGIVYMENDMVDSAIHCFTMGEMYFSKSNYKRGLGFCNYYLGYMYNRKHLYPMALTAFEMAGKIFKESSNYTELPNIYNCIADVYIKMKQPQKSLAYAKMSLDESIREKSTTDIKEAYRILKEVYEANGDFKTALTYYEKYVNMKDSLFNSESTAQMAEMQTKYETVKKENENKLLQEKNESNAKTIRTQKYFGIAVAIICVLLIAFAFVIFRSNKQKHRVNLELEKKNTLIEKQKSIVEEKQKEILDSIHYAKRIQGSLLTSEKYIGRTIRRLTNT